MKRKNKPAPEVPLPPKTPEVVPSKEPFPKTVEPEIVPAREPLTIPPSPPYISPPPERSNRGNIY